MSAKNENCPSQFSRNPSWHFQMSCLCCFCPASCLKFIGSFKYHRKARNKKILTFEKHLNFSTQCWITGPWGWLNYFCGAVKNYIWKIEQQPVFQETVYLLLHVLVLSSTKSIYRNCWVKVTFLIHFSHMLSYILSFDCVGKHSDILQTWTNKTTICRVIKRKERDGLFFFLIWLNRPVRLNLCCIEGSFNFNVTWWQGFKKSM